MPIRVATVEDDPQYRSSLELLLERADAFELVRRLEPLSTDEGGGAARFELTEREVEVLRCLVGGMSYKRAAQELEISLDTVRSHIRSVYSKLQVHNVAEAVSRALREGIV